MKTQLSAISTIASLAIFGHFALGSEISLDPIIVTSSDFREQNLSTTDNSITVITENELYDKAHEPPENIIGKTPNVNFTSGASRAHYIQIRGIGERSQFETPVNPSVGINIDDIDFSQSALGVTMFDTRQIEVLRGPQGTAFGANGMAGVINMQSNEPTKFLEGHIESTIGNYGTATMGMALGGPIVDNKLTARASIYKNRGDGFMINSYLNRDDTSNIDELTAKLRLRWLASKNHTINLNLMHINIDNGYDDFTLDNSRVSHTDEPGRDKQETNAIALKSLYQINTDMHMITKLSHSGSDLLYSYDEDWSFVGEFDDSLWPYHYFDQYARDREHTDLDMKLVSDGDGRIFNKTTDWTIGLYTKKQTEDLTRSRTKETIPTLFKSKYKTKNIALYGQIDSIINPKFTLSAGLRIEKWKAEYKDSNSIEIFTDETLIGGKIGFKYQQNSNDLYYINLSKGYKPGGVNAGQSLPKNEKRFKTETLWNIEVGMNSSYLNGKLKNRLNLFYGKRRNQQVKKYIEKTKNFVNYLSNAAKGHYLGLEAELDYYPTDALHLYANLGLLKAEFDNYTSALQGRSPAQSPRYQYNLGLNYMFADNWSIKADMTGKGGYYFSDTHNEKSHSYTILNSSLEYTTGDWTLALWVKNITDKNYDTRGFFFENDPSLGYTKAKYTQKGAPRTFGFTISYDF